MWSEVAKAVPAYAGIRHGLTALATAATLLFAFYSLSVWHQLQPLGGDDGSNSLTVVAPDCPEREHDFDRVIRIGMIEDTADGWRERMEIFAAQMPEQVWLGEPAKTGSTYFQQNWEPVITCSHEMRMGRAGDGGKWVCNPEMIPENALVYSFGSNGEFGFEQNVLAMFPAAEIHTFDFSNFSAYGPKEVHFHQWGLDGSRHTTADGKEFYDLPTIVETLGHSDRAIDIFKIDIEGSEFAALIPVLESGKFPKVNQIQIELHFIPGILDYVPLNKLFKLFHENAKLEIFHKEPNIQYSSASATASEYSLVRMEWPRLVEAGIVSQVEYDSIIASAQPNYEHAF